MIAEQSVHDAYEIFDSLTSYEVAMLAFTSPRVVKAQPDDEDVITLTGKEAYLWAGAIAHAVMRRPEWSAADIAARFGRALMSVTQDVLAQTPQAFYTSSNTSNVRPNSDVVQLFARDLGFSDEREEIFRATAEAVQNLIARGYIEDPFKKRVGAILIAVVLNFPVGFTSPGPREVKIETLTWKYTQQPVGDHVKREFHVKVKEACDLVLKKIVPAIVDAADTLSGTTPEPIPLEDVQKKLARRGYYTGKIDGKMGPITEKALKQFQQDNRLEVTGRPDAATIKQLA